MIKSLHDNPQLTGRIVAALYNVCSEFDELAKDENGQAWPAPDTEITTAEQQLWQASVSKRSPDPSRPEATKENDHGRLSIQTLLESVDHCPEDLMIYLALLLEVVMRPLVYTSGDVSSLFKNMEVSPPHGLIARLSRLVDKDAARHMSSRHSFLPPNSSARQTGPRADAYTSLPVTEYFMLFVGPKHPDRLQPS